MTVRREIDGFILNRLQGALLSEAMRLVGEGYVSPEDLDKTVAHGLGLRWSFMGPFATIELNAPGRRARIIVRVMPASIAASRRIRRRPTCGTATTWRVVARSPRPRRRKRERRMDWRDRRLLALARPQGGTGRTIAKEP